MTTIHHWFYLAGYGGWIMPRFLRRVTARSEFHRAWVLGSLGFFEENGARFGPANPYPPFGCPSHIIKHRESSAAR